MNPVDDEHEKPTVAGPTPVKITAGDTDPLIGTVFAERYKILEFIGAGGWSNVYRAQHLTLHVSIAIKVIHKHLTKDEESLKRLEQEANLLSRLESPNIVRVMDYGLIPTPYIVMEYFDGEPLDQWLKSKGFLKSSLAIELFMQICRGLSNAHAQGFVHRDLKPSNIMLKLEDKQIKSKILDFGIAKLIDENNRLTSTGQILGSPPYMSPEQWKGCADYRSDLYSLGCIMYEVLSSKPAFSAEHGLDYAGKHFAATPARIKITAPLADFPEALEDLINKCLAKAPEQRYQSAGEVLAELERVKTGRKLQIRINKERQERQKKIIISLAVVIASLTALFCWQRETIVAPWYYHFNAIADKEKDRAKYKSAIQNYRTSLLAADILPRQYGGTLHAMRMLSFCLRQQNQFKEAAQLQTQVDEAIGSGPWPELNSLLRRLNYRLNSGADLKGTLELGQRTMHMATALAGNHTLAYAQALDALSSIMRAQGLYDQALQTERQSLSICEDLLEPDSVTIAERLNHLGIALQAAGNLKNAEQAYDRALEICSKHNAETGIKLEQVESSGQSLVLADFNNGMKTNNVGGELGTWEKDASDKTQGTQISFASDDAPGLSSGKCLQLDYDVDSPNKAFNGFWMKLSGGDFSGDFSNYDTLNFYMKGNASIGFTRRLKLELKDFTNKPSPYFVDCISDRWQKFSIPFDRFKMISDLSRMNEFVIKFEDVDSRPKTGRIYLDQVFVSCENQQESKTGALAQMVAACDGLASIHIQRSDRQGALTYLEKAYQLCRNHKELDPLHVLTNLASLYQEAGDRKKALQYWSKALECCRDDGSSEWPDTEIILSSLAEICCQQKDYIKAEIYLEEGYKVRAQAPDQEKRLKIVLANLIKIKQALGKAAEVADLAQRSKKLEVSPVTLAGSSR